MTTTPEPASSNDSSSEARGSAFVRAVDDRVVAGVTAGLGHRLGIDPLVVRIAMVILTLAGGAGLLLYALAWLLSRDPVADEQVEANDFDGRQTLALGLVTLGVTLLLRTLGIWFSDALVWPALVAGAISAIVWMRSAPDDTTGASLADPSPIRIIIAAVITFAAMATFWAIVPQPHRVVVPLIGLVIGGGLLASPIIARMWSDLEAERAETARQVARDEVAAHLHDSVLQTLTLIQRTDDPRRTTTLARTQERELRAWLYGARDLRGASRDLESTVDDLVTDIELNHEIEVDAVVVGTVTNVDDHRHVVALLGALREALVNVARHADVATASLYVEVEDGRVTAFVRDRGSGFDPATVPADRHGLRDSIHARLRRHGGGAQVHTEPGGGTEVEVWVHHTDTDDTAHASPTPPPAPAGATQSNEDSP